MLTPPKPLNEDARLSNLYAYDILDSNEEEDFTDLIEIAANICGCPISQISFVDKDRQWFKAKKGSELTETSRDISFCGHAILNNDLFIVEDATKDERFYDNPLVTEGLRINFYTGAPILSSSGHALGAICVLDQKPRTLNEEQKESLRRLSRQVSRLLELRIKAKELQDYSAKLSEETSRYKKAKEEAENASLVKSRFLSTMSHEIRTPMNAVIGFTHLLQQSATAEQIEYLKALKFSADNLLCLLNDILDLSKIEEGKIQFENTPFSIQELCRNIHLSFHEQAKEKGLYLKLELDSNLPSQVGGDPIRLGQVLNNLVNNALKFTAKGGIIVKVQLLSASKTNQRLSFEVIDTGIGISSAQQKKIFEVFTQASSDTTRKFGGSGLGLAIVKRLLELQGSAIQVKSKEGEGAAFSFELEFSVCSFNMATEQTEISCSTLPLKGTKVLLVEDNPINVLLAKQFLKQWEVDFDVANNGCEAVEAVQQKNYDIVLMDLQMPEMDGYQATENIRALPQASYKTIPIIALTASALLEERQKVFSVGMNDFITKPFKPDELRDKISRYRKVV